MITNLTNMIDTAVAEGAFEGELEDNVEGHSFYSVTKLLNEALSHYGLKEVTMQYVRNLSLNGKIDGVKRTSMKDVRFGEEDVAAFIVKFVGRKVASK